MPEYNLCLVGFGNVGRALARLLQTKTAELHDQYGIDWRITGVGTRRKGWLANPDGLDVPALLGGEQQMLAMARGLVLDPRILLLDEPSMGLAPVLVDAIFAIIQELHDKGTTILLVEQNARLALQVADRGYILQTGSIVMHDSAEQLRSSEMVRKAYLGEE